MLASNWPSVDKAKEIWIWNKIIQVNSGAVKPLLDQRALYHCSQVVMRVCVWGGQPVSLEWWQCLFPDTSLAFPPHLPSVCAPAKEVPVCPCQLGTSLCSLGHQSLGCSQGHGGNHVLHQLLGNQTTKRLKMTIKIKSSSTYLIVETEWVLKLVGWVPRPFPAFSTWVLSLPLCSLHPHARKKGCWLPVLTWSKLHWI